MDIQRRNLIAGSALAPLALLAAQSGGARPAPMAGRPLPPNVVLTTHRGQRVRFYDDLVRGDRIVVINFMYAQCGDICPGTSGNLAQVQRMLGARMGRDVFLYSISLEPRQDTPEILAHYAATFDAGPGWTFLTGEPAGIERLRRSLGFVDRDPDIDRDRNQHIGMVRIGNDALGRWMACPALGQPRQLAREILWVGLQRSA